MCKEKASLIQAVLHNDVTQVQILLATGCSADTTQDREPYDNWPILTIAACLGYKEIVLSLLEAGANVDLASNDGITALYAAAQNRHKKILQHLLQARATVDLARNNGVTPLMIAAYHNRKQIVKVLLRAQAQVDLVENRGATALYLAAQNSHKKIVKLLLQAGAKVDLANHDSLTPLCTAASLGHQDIVKILLRAQAQADLVNRHGETALIVATIHGYKKIVKLLLKAKANADLASNYGNTPLLFATEKGHKEIIELLIKAGAQVNLPNPRYGATPLLFAIQNGDKETVELLLKAGAQVNLPSNDGATPLFLAAQNNHKEILELLLRAGAQVNLARDDGVTPLLIAVQNGHKEIIELLITAGANVNLASTDGDIPLIFAIQDNHKEIIELLITAGANVNLASDDGATPMLFAAQKGHKEIVALLLTAGAQVNSARKDGATPLFIAAQKGHKEIIELLITAGANVNVLLASTPTPLCIATYKNYIEIVKILLNAGANMDLTNDYGNTPLMIAAYNGYKELLEILLKAGAQVDLVTKITITPLWLASYNGHKEIVTLLLQAGAQVDVAAQDGTTPLYNAAKNGYQEIVALLLQAGAKVDVVKTYGLTPLMIAAQKGHLEIVATLLQGGANVALKEIFGKTALDLAKENNHTEIVTLLEQDSFEVTPLQAKLQELFDEAKMIVLLATKDRDVELLSRKNKHKLRTMILYLETLQTKDLDTIGLITAIDYLASKKEWLNQLPAKLAQASARVARKHAKKLGDLKKMLTHTMQILTRIKNDICLLPSAEREELRGFINYLKSLQPETLDKAALRKTMRSLANKIPYLEALTDKLLAMRHHLTELATKVSLLREEMLSSITASSSQLLPQDEQVNLRSFIEHLRSLQPNLLDEITLNQEIAIIEAKRSYLDKIKHIGTLQQAITSSEVKVHKALQQGKYERALSIYNHIKTCYEKLITLGIVCNKELQEVVRNIEKIALITKLHWRIPYSELKFTEVKLGTGTFGAVWRGTWGSKTLAIKKLTTETSYELLQAFVEEVNIIMRLDSEYLVPLLGVSCDPYCLVMEYLPKGSLYSLIHSEEQFTWPVLLQIAIDIGSGLHFLHQEGIIYQNLQSSKVLITQDNRAKLAAFSLRKLTPNLAPLTVAPELLDVTTVTYTYKTDIYAYGIVIWEIQTALLAPTKRKDPIKPLDLPQTCPLVLRTTIERCLDVPEKRPPALEIVQALQAELAVVSLKPWHIEPNLKPRGTNSAGYYLLPAGDYDTRKVVTYYQHCPVPGMEVGRVTIIFNPTLEHSFATTIKLLEQQLGKHKLVQPYLCLKYKCPEVATILPMGYLFTLDKLYYVNSTLTEIPITRTQLTELKTKLGITLAAMDQEPQPLSYEALQVIAAITGKIPELEIATWRLEVLRQLEAMTHPYQDPEAQHVKLLPVWHGTHKDLVAGIASSGYANLASTDVGFFGKGLYSSYEAEYAYRVYGPGNQANGVLLMNWVSCSAAYPVVGYEVREYTGMMPDATDEPGDILKLQGGGSFENFDAHFVPVRPSKMNPEGCYYPSRPGERATYHELVVFNRSQMLPRYLVELQPTLVAAPAIAPLLAAYGVWQAPQEEAAPTPKPQI